MPRARLRRQVRRAHSPAPSPPSTQPSHNNPATMPPVGGPACGGALAPPAPVLPPAPPPAGVMLPHNAVVSTVASLSATLERLGEPLGPGDSMLSYLPLAHIFDRRVGCRVPEELVLVRRASRAHGVGQQWF